MTELYSNFKKFQNVIANKVKQQTQVCPTAQNQRSKVGLDPQRNRITAGRRDTPRPWPSASGEYSSQRRGESPSAPRTRTTYRPQGSSSACSRRDTTSPTSPHSNTEAPSTGRPCSSCPPCKLSPAKATRDRSGWWPLGDSTSFRSLSGLADPLYCTFGYRTYLVK